MHTCSSEEISDFPFLEPMSMTPHFVSHTQTQTQTNKQTNTHTHTHIHTHTHLQFLHTYLNWTNVLGPNRSMSVVQSFWSLEGKRLHKLATSWSMVWLSSCASCSIRPTAIVHPAHVVPPFSPFEKSGKTVDWAPRAGIAIAVSTTANRIADECMLKR